MSAGQSGSGREIPWDSAWPTELARSMPQPMRAFQTGMASYSCFGQSRRPERPQVLSRQRALGIANPTDRPGSISNGVDLMLGAWSSTLGDTSFFTGMLDEVSVYNRALDSAEIRCIFLADSRGKCQPDTKLQLPLAGRCRTRRILDRDRPGWDYRCLFAGGENPQDRYCPTFRSTSTVTHSQTALDLSDPDRSSLRRRRRPCEPCAP